MGVRVRAGGLTTGGRSRGRGGGILLSRFVVSAVYDPAACSIGLSFIPFGSDLDTAGVGGFELPSINAPVASPGVPGVFSKDWPYADNGLFSSIKDEGEPVLGVSNGFCWP